MVGNAPNPPKQSNWSKTVFVFFPVIFLCMCVMSITLICVFFCFSHILGQRERWGWSGTTRLIWAEGRRARQSTSQQTDPNSFPLFVHPNRPLMRIFTKLPWNYFISLSTAFRNSREHRGHDGSRQKARTLGGSWSEVCFCPSETVSLSKIGHVTPDRKSESAGGMNLWPRAFAIL